MVKAVLIAIGKRQRVFPSLSGWRGMQPIGWPLWAVTGQGGMVWGSVQNVG